MTPSPFIIVAIDGGAASGKSTSSRVLSERFNLLHVDTGSFYRALTAAVLRGGTDPAGWSEATVLAEAPRVSVQPGGRSFAVCVDGARVDEEIRGGEVTRSVSRVASMPGVRRWVNEQLAAGHTTAALRTSMREAGYAFDAEASRPDRMVFRRKSP